MWDNAEAMERLTRWLLVMMAMLLAASGLVWFYNSNHLPVKQVSLKGNLVYSDKKALGSLAKEYIHGNILRTDINGAQEAYRRYPWIASVMVRRRFPDTVEVVLTERKPVARWGDHALVDGEGNVLKPAWTDPECRYSEARKERLPKCSAVMTNFRLFWQNRVWASKR